MEMENHYASKGVGGTALGLSIGALGAELLGGTFNNVLGNGNAGNYSRYDAEKDAKIAALEVQVSLRDANTYTDGKLLELYKYVDGKFACVEHELADQRVYNAVNTTTIGCIKNDIAELMALTKRIVPNSSVYPGWGEVTVAVTPASTTPAAG